MKMKTREELVMFNDEQTKEILDDIKKDVLPMYDFEKEIPPIINIELSTIATSISMLTNEYINKNDKIDFLLKIINSLNAIVPELFLLMVDMGISDIFTISEDGIMVLKEEYVSQINTKVLSPINE